MPSIFPKRRGDNHRSIRAAVSAAAALLCASSVALGGNFVEPPVFASLHGVLDILIVVLPQPVPSIAYMPPGGGVINPIGWVYQICRRPSAIARLHQLRGVGDAKVLKSLGRSSKGRHYRG
jgi:hypothetical protein